MSLNCQECGQPTTVPGTASNAQEEDLRRHLKENESQRTEVTGYINQLNIQLHRWQIRLQTLNERNAELKAQIKACSGPVAADR